MLSIKRKLPSTAILPFPDFDLVQASNGRFKGYAMIPLLNITPTFFDVSND
jgi:hypothetical protein